MNSNTTNLATVGEHQHHSEDFLDMKISKVLNALGITPKVKGYDYLHDAIRYMSLNDNDVYIVKELYPYVAEKRGTTPSAVERDIRWAIGKMRQVKIVYRIFGQYRHYSNKEFILLVSRYINCASS